VFTARYGLIPYIKQITFRIKKVNVPLLLAAPWRTVIKRLKIWWRRRSFPEIGFHQDPLIYTNPHPTLQRTFFCLDTFWKCLMTVAMFWCCHTVRYYLFSHHTAVYICNLCPLTPTFKCSPNWLPVCDKKKEHLDKIVCYGSPVHSNSEY
jgi:hypothetical protein